MNQKSKILIFITTIIVIIISYLYFAEYSISEITAENYMYKLEQNKNESIFSSNATSNYLENNIFLTDANTIVYDGKKELKSGQFQFTFDKGIDFRRIDIINAKDYVGFTINYNDNNLAYGYSVFDNPIDNNKSTVKKYLEKLMSKNELTIKKSNNRTGYANKNCTFS